MRASESALVKPANPATSRGRANGRDPPFSGCPGGTAISRHLTTRRRNPRVSAELKLSTAGLPVNLLYATADDAEARVDIFALAWDRATAHSAAPRATILIGDRVWDVACARQLGWRFVGVGTGAAAARLREAGATMVVPDYAGLDVHEMLQPPEVPRNDGAAA